MKTVFNIFIFLMGSFFLQNCLAANSSGVAVKLTGKQAKQIYNAMTGPDVQNEGAAGHSFREGKCIVCRYVNADMDDKKGRPVKSGDPMRYSCTFKLDQNGTVSPDKT